MPTVLLNMLITSLVPVAADGIRGIFNYFTGAAGAEPANVEERVKLMNAEVEKLKAVAALDVPGGVLSPWVANLRGSFRYIAAGVIIVPVPFILIYAIIYPESLSVVTVYLNDVAGPVFGFMFGDRLRIHLRKSA